jgi:hypothetical protein
MRIFRIMCGCDVTERDCECAPKPLRPALAHGSAQRRLMEGGHSRLAVFAAALAAGMDPWTASDVLNGRKPRGAA